MYTTVIQQFNNKGLLTRKTYLLESFFKKTDSYSSVQ